MSRNGQVNAVRLRFHQEQMETYINWDHTFNDVHKVGVVGIFLEQADNNNGFGLIAYNFKQWCAFLL